LAACEAYVDHYNGLQCVDTDLSETYCETETDAVCERAEYWVCLQNGTSCDGDTVQLDIGDCDPTCGGSFFCNDGTAIPAYWACDNFDDCDDGEDEYPTNPTCAEPLPDFVCNDGTEIPAYWACDAYNDCDDGEDEYPTNPACEPPFVCADGEEIPMSWVCDDYEDCVGGEDEPPLNTDCP
jgi:hypothetical protein